MKIGAREVGPGAPVFIIAEIGSNHGGSLDRALALIDAAADTGADAAKFQRFRVDRFLVPRPDPASLRKYELPDDWLPLLKSKCQSRDLEFLCTAFDLDSLGEVDPFVDAHKIGSAEAGLGYTIAVAARGKPLIYSDGMMGAKRWNITSVPNVHLRCVSKYPAQIEDYHLRVYAQPWGVSDHTLHPTIIPAAAVALGACVVEKHMTLDGYDSPDSAVSITAHQFSELVAAVRLTEKAVRG